MTAAAVGLVWVLTGALAARLASPSDTPWWRWVPIANLFGPMWFFVAVEQVDRGADAEPAD